MKKLMLLVPVAALAMASCSSEDVVQQKTTSTAQELTIRPVVQGATRSLITDANFNTFHVVATITNGGTYAFWQEQDGGTAPTSATDAGDVKTSLDVDVTKTTGKWETLSGKKWYWSSKNAEASFVGYNASGAITVLNPVADQKDVIVAYNKGVASTFDNGVPMLFRHVLSQIVIKADNKDADVRQIKVAAVRIHNVGNTNNLTLPSSETTADKFKWYSAEATDGYKPWAVNPATQTEKYYYYKGTTAPSGGTVSGSITLNASAQDITFDGPALLLPQTNAAATDLTTENAGGKAYIDVLVQVQDLEKLATERAKTDGQEFKDVAVFPKVTTTQTTESSLNSTQTFAWVAVPVDIAWNPGYKYTYVLHFSKDGIGKVSPDEEGGEDEPGVEPGKEIVDNPVPLYFTVTIDEWQDAANTEKNL